MKDGPKHIGELFPRDDQGRRVIGDPNSGCRHCGAVVTQAVPEHPHIVVYRQALECCAPALLDRIEGVNATIRSYEQMVNSEGVPGASVEAKVFAALDERKRLQRVLHELEAA